MSFGPVLQKPPRALPEKVSASIVPTRAGTLRLVLAISKNLWHRLQLPKRCNIQVGQESDAGKLRVVFASNGAYRIAGASMGGGKIILGLIDGIPEGFSFRALDCEFESSPTHLVVTLPLKAWNDMVSQ